jgi:hypothetical protein
LGAAFVALTVPALAQMPPPLPPEAMNCLCLKQSVDVANADMAAKTAALDSVRSDLNRLDAQLAEERGKVDVNDPQAVAQFRQQLQERDTAFRRSTGEVFAASQAATGHYNAAVADYNNQCAGRPLPPPPPGPLACPMR